MLRKLVMLCLVFSATFGVAVARYHGASAQGAVLCGLLKVPHAAASAQSTAAGVPSHASGDLPCTSIIVAEAPTPTPTATPRPTATPTPTPTPPPPTPTPTPGCQPDGNPGNNCQCDNSHCDPGPGPTPTPSTSLAQDRAQSQAAGPSEIHCTWSYSVSLSRTGSDPSVVTGPGTFTVHWSDGGSSTANVTAVGGFASAGPGVEAIELVGTIASGRFAGGLLSFETGVIAGMPVTQIVVVFA